MAAAAAIALENPSTLNAAQVAAKAGVSRSAFYVHFDSLPDLAEAMLAEMMLESASRFYPVTATEKWSIELHEQLVLTTEHFAEHRELYRAVRNMPGAMQALDALLEMLTTIALSLLENHPRLPAHVDPTSAARWLGGGAFNLLDGWLRTEPAGSAMTTTEMAHTLYHLLPDWFRLE